MAFKKGHTLWKHPNCVKNRFKKGDVSLRKGVRKSCPHGEYGYWFCNECQRPYKRAWEEKNKEKINKLRREKYKKMTNDLEKMEKVRKYHREWAKTPAGVLKYYRRNARERNLDFQITKETFIRFWDEPCFYCGEKVRRGFDRINSEQGYSENNIVPSCAVCNWMKRDMTQEEFYDRCRRVVLFSSPTPEELGFYKG